MEQTPISQVTPGGASSAIPNSIKELTSSVLQAGLVTSKRVPTCGRILNVFASELWAGPRPGLVISGEQEDITTARVVVALDGHADSDLISRLRYRGEGQTFQLPVFDSLDPPQLYRTTVAVPMFAEWPPVPQAVSPGVDAAKVQELADTLRELDKVCTQIFADVEKLKAFVWAPGTTSAQGVPDETPAPAEPPAS